MPKDAAGPRRGGEVVVVSVAYYNNGVRRQSYHAIEAGGSPAFRASRLGYSDLDARDCPENEPWSKMSYSIMS